MHGLRRRLLFALPLSLLSLTGCHRWCCRHSGYTPSASALVRASGSSGGLHPLTPCPVPISPGPPPAAPFAPPAQVAPPALGDPIPGGVTQGGFQDVSPGLVEPKWGAAKEPSVTLEAPQPIPPERPRVADSLPPQSPEPPTAKPALPAPRAGVVEDRRPTPPQPAGIFGFAPAKDDVSTGRRPMLEGLDWLKERGYRAALYLRPPGEDDVTDRRELETKRGLKYLTLEVSSEKLTKSPEIVDEFNRLVADKANRPLFVYDRDGMLAGGLWYLHFRTVDRLSDEEALRKAAELGLKPDKDGPHRDMILAVQKYLADHPQP